MFATALECAKPDWDLLIQLDSNKSAMKACNKTGHSIKSGARLTVVPTTECGLDVVCASVKTSVDLLYEWLEQPKLDDWDGDLP